MTTNSPQTMSGKIYKMDNNIFRSGSDSGSGSGSRQGEGSRPGSGSRSKTPSPQPILNTGIKDIKIISLSSKN